MSTTAHTPGPWANGYGSGVTGGRAAAACSWDCTNVHSFPIRRGKEIVAWVAAYEPSADEKQKMEADARLIAAAPELLEALQACYDWFEADGPLDATCAPEMRKARDVIAKATGSAA